MFQSPDEIFAFFQKEELGSTTFSTRCAFLQVLCNYTKQLLFVSLTNEKLSQAGLYNSVKLLSNFTSVSELLLHIKRPHIIR